MPRQATFVTKNQKTGDFSAHGSQSVKKVALGVTALSALSGINAIAGQSSQVFAIDPTTYDGFEYATKNSIDSWSDGSTTFNFLNIDNVINSTYGAPIKSDLVWSSKGLTASNGYTDFTGFQLANVSSYQPLPEDSLYPNWYYKGNMSIDFSNELFQIPNYKYVGNNYPGTTIKFDTYKYHNVDGSSFFNLIYEEVADSKSANISLHLNDTDSTPESYFDGLTELSNHLASDVRSKNGYDCWIYSDGYGENATYYRFRTDGSEQTQLTDYTITMNYYDGTYGYVVKKSMEDGGLVRVPLDGSAQTRVRDAIPFPGYCITSDSIYTRDEKDTWQVLKTDLDGTNAKQVFRANDQITAINVYENKLIVAYGVYSDKDGNTVSREIAIVDLATGEIIRSWTAHTDPLCVGEGLLFYTEQDEGMRWHCVNIDTGEELKME